MATIDLGSLYSQMQLDISGFLRAAKTAEKTIDHLRDELHRLTKQSAKALGQVIAPTITPGKLPFFQPAAPVPPAPTGPMIPPLSPTVIPQLTQVATLTQRLRGYAAAAGSGFLQLGTSLNTSLGAATMALMNFRTLILGFGAMRFLGNVVEDIAQFDKAVAAVRAVINSTTTGEMTQLVAQFRRIGATSVFSATEAAQGAEELARAGMKATEIMAALNPIMDLAIAGQTSFKEAADFTIATLFAFNRPASETGRIADVIAFAANESRANVSGLGLALSYAASTAHSAGISLEETSAALATLAQGGLRASTTGTGLRGVIASLIQPTQKAKAMLQAMGITPDQVNPSLHSLADVLGILREKGMSAQQAFALFPRQTANAALALVNGLPFYRQTYEAMDRIDGSARRTALAITNNLADAFKQLHNVFIEASLQMGDAGLTGTLRTMTDTLTNTLRALLGFLEPFGPGAEQAYALAQAVKALGIALGVLVTAMAAAAIKTFALPFIAAHPVIFLVAAGVTALAAGYALLSTESQRYAVNQRNIVSLMHEAAAFDTTTSDIILKNWQKKADAAIQYQ